MFCILSQRILGSEKKLSADVQRWPHSEKDELETVNTFFLFFVVIVLWIVRLWYINTNYSRGFWEPYTTLGRQKWGVRRPYDIWADCQSLKGFTVLWQQPQLLNNMTSSHSPDLPQTGDLSLFSSRILLSLFSSSPIAVVAIIIL